MEGVITAFSGTTLVVNVDSIGGSGTYANWTISVAGIQGSNGVTSFSGNSTGLTPATATTGAITLAGILVGANGGTGVANTGKTITVGGNLVHAGAFTQTFTATANTSLTLPISGTVLSSVTAPTANPITGTPSASNYLRGDGTWATFTTGTVTSVAATVPAFLSISGSPITSSGTLAITLSGTALPVANGGTGLTSGGPAFNCYQSVAQAITLNTYTKITFDIEVFDTNNNFASSRFTPTVSGYYQINAGVQPAGLASVSPVIYLNGAAYAYGTQTPILNYVTSNMSVLVYLNGTTDYVEYYVALSASLNTNPASSTVYFSGAMVRKA
jgi:hypothetical protein